MGEERQAGWSRLGQPTQMRAAGKGDGGMGV
jgi:hypothetical protein